MIDPASAGPESVGSESVGSESVGPQPADASCAAYFFVNPPQVRTLRQQILPELLDRAAALNGRLRVWSVDCGTGEEPYTVAMLVREALRDPYGWDIKIVGTAASDTDVRQGAAGRYGMRSLVMTDPVDAHRWFRRVDQLYAISREIRSLVQLRHCDLASEPLPYAAGEVGLVLWRDPPPDAPGLVARVLQTLAPGGYLLLGPTASDVRLPQGTLVQLGDAYVYRRPAGGCVPTEGERRKTLAERRTADEGSPPLGLGRERRGTPRRAGTTGLTPDLSIDLTDPTEASARACGRLLRDARAALVRGDFEQAAAQAAQACGQQPGDPAGWYLCGVALINAHRDAEAVEHLRSAARCDPADGFTHFVLAGALVRLGRSGEAGAAYREAARTLGRPGDELAPELGGRTLAELIRQCARLGDELWARRSDADQNPGQT